MDTQDVTLRKQPKTIGRGTFFRSLEGSRQWESCKRAFERFEARTRCMDGMMEQGISVYYGVGTPAVPPPRYDDVFVDGTKA